MLPQEYKFKDFLVGNIPVIFYPASPHFTSTESSKTPSYFIHYQRDSTY